jgi:NADPH-dependent curcumin reductase CurA
MNELDQLRNQVAGLLETRGNHEAKLEGLTTQMAALTTAVTGLTATLNRGRGALWAVCAAAGAAGAVVTGLIEWVRH